ncbi:hypothetical protein J0X14_05385 [Muricauda sp. CAU 1633]|uniref:hypothetical protein n=1 Tax=Allomuricauda sp. CAU 1633 TaxID=2816036 RepID=UPI001A8C91F7|nr:hypothetical protein [Muricauda sp. CAU 1633]MBO0321719.1 hypothetical protein [Muricauda sp. CAU 1633]
MRKKNIFGMLFVIGAAISVSAQGNIHVQGEGGVFTADRLALLKNGEGGGLGNNPAMMNLYSDMRMKFGRMGEEVNLTLDDIDGTIYLNENFTLGTLYEDGVAFKKLYLRYDAYNDEVELKESIDANVVRAMVQHPRYSCSVNGNDYLFVEYFEEDGTLKEGYLSPLVSGGDYVLFVKNIKVFKEGKPAKTSLDNSFPHRFLDRTEYYVSVNGKSPVLMKTKKSDVLSLFAEEDQKAIKDYMKDKRPNVKDVDDLRNLFAYGNSL